MCLKALACPDLSVVYHVRPIGKNGEVCMVRAVSVGGSLPRVLYRFAS